jgi:GNAT superfamily N-acetyltransferase
MLTPVPPAERALLKPLFEGFTGMHGVIDSVVEGVLGEAWADDLAQPRIAALNLDFFLVAGDHASPAAAVALSSLKPGDHVAVPDTWLDLLLDTVDTLQPYDRFGFSSPDRWDRGQLDSTRGALPDGFRLKRVDEHSVREFEALADSLVYNFESPQVFLARGVGFGIWHDGRCIAGCSSYAISSRSIEFEIQTHPDYRRRGLALVTGSRMIEHCLDNGLEPCWDAAHEGSADLAEKLGFVDRRPYTAYRVG